MIKYLCLTSIAVLIITLANCSLSTTQNILSPAYSRNTGGTIHGTVLFENKINNKSNHTYLTDFNLQLLDLNTNRIVFNIKTDFFGRYYFPLIKKGTYKIQWPAQKGWQKGNLPTIMQVNNSILYAEQIKPIAQEENIVVTGRVEMQSGKATFFDEVFSIQSIPEIQFNNGSLIQRTDIFGQFALCISKIGQINILVNKSIEQQFTLDANKHASYVINNNSPILLGFNVTDGNTNIRYPKSGETISLSALVIDPDNDTLTYQWKIQGIENAEYNNNNLTISLPKGQGTIIAQVIVTDGKGSFIHGRHKIGYGQTQEVFSGTLYARNTNIRIENVEVTINQIKTSTDINGYFRLFVPIADNYSLLFKKQGYTSYGQTYLNSQEGKTFNLRKVESQNVNPGQEIILFDKGARLEVPMNGLVDSNGNIPQNNLIANFTLLDIENNEFPGDFIGREGDKTTALVSFGMVDIHFYDEKGRVYNLAKGSEAKITIPIAGQQKETILKNAPSTIPIWTYNEITGEWDRSGQANLDREIKSYVGTIVHFSTINMDQPGSGTCIRVLSDPVLMNMYIRVSDVSGDGIDYATVKEVQIDDALSAIYRLPANQKVKIEVLNGPGGTIIPDIVIDVFDSAQPQNGWLPNNSNEIISGGAITNLFPGYPYQECPITIHLKHQPNSNPSNSSTDYTSFFAYKGIGNSIIASDYYSKVDEGNHRLTLNDWLIHNGYTVDGSSPVVYGNNTDFNNYFNTAFLNNNDLGSGRDMHFLKNPDGTVSSYVANYGNFDQNQGNADKAANRDFLPGDVVATVCMEWSPLDNATNQWIDHTTSTPIPFNKEIGPLFSPGYIQKVKSNSIVKFFVFVQTAAGQLPPRVLSANLDGYQDKFIPNLCFNCHNGSPGLDPTTGLLANPYIDVRFRELDYQSYKFSGPRDHTGLTEPEKDNFEGQNEIVRGDNTANLSSQAIKELIDIWYGDNDNIQQIAIPDGWKKNIISSPTLNFIATDHPEKLYTNVVAKSCRTCHAAFDGIAAGPDLGFNQYIDFEDRKPSISGYLTNTGVMPHASITHRNFWTDTEPELDENGNVITNTSIHRASYLRQYQDNVWFPPIQ